MRDERRVQARAAPPSAPPAFDLKLTAALLAAKAASTASRRLGRGGGTALPGLISQRLVPDAVECLGRQFGLGAAMITGTNGKTTTTAMTARIAAQAGRRVVHNRSGSNLMRGLAATLAEEVGLSGRLKNAESTMGVLEVDEATLLQAITALPPATVTFLNLFRDQLDRYGEVDAVFARWRQCLEVLPTQSLIVVNADDPTVAALAEQGKCRSISFGIDDVGVTLSGQEHASDARWCHVCGTEYRYSALFAGHVGIWRCEGCGRSRQQPHVAATRVSLQGFDRVDLSVATPEGELDLSLPLGGVYNAYNALAAIATSLAYGLPLRVIGAALQSFGAAFGRQERFVVRGRSVRILLGKNPAGLNQVLRLLAGIPGRKNLLIILNDGIADGTDVSWIWDVDYERLTDQVDQVVVSGTRASEMAVRLKYADWRNYSPVISSIPPALDDALRRTETGKDLYVVPTYTAMLEVRELLAKLSGSKRFWER